VWLHCFSVSLILFWEDKLTHFELLIFSNGPETFKTSKTSKMIGNVPTH